MAFEYDEHVYPSVLFPQAHPDRMATIAVLNGLQPAPVDQCRVLEIACYNGTNLLPMAANFPESRFLGVDLASGPIADGRQLAKEAGLSNLDLQHMDVVDFPANAGTFDYIYAHGFYSWVPEFVRTRFWEIVDHHLADNGILYVSYNAQPAGHLRNLTREMMLFHLDRVKPPAAGRAAAAVEFLERLAESSSEESVWKSWTGFEFDRLSKIDPDGLHHDELAENYRPFSLVEVAASAAKVNLQFLGESRVRQSLRAPNPVVEAWAPSSFVESEQYRDYLEFRSFRESLFCRQHHAIDRAGAVDRIGQLWAATRLRRDGVHYQHPRSPLRVQTEYAPAIALMERLITAWPSGVRLNEEELPLSMPLIQTDAIELRTQPGLPAGGPGPNPAAPGLVRAQLARFAESSTLLHDIARIPDGAEREFLRSLDGSRRVEELPGAFADKLDEYYRQGLLLPGRG